MSADHWTDIRELPLPLIRIEAADEKAYTSRRVLLYFPSGEQSVGRVELHGNWLEKVQDQCCDYLAATERGRPCDVVWATEDSAVHGMEPSHWRDLPERPRVVTGFALFPKTKEEAAGFPTPFAEAPKGRPRYR